MVDRIPPIKNGGTGAEKTPRRSTRSTRAQKTDATPDVTAGRNANNVIKANGQPSSKRVGVAKGAGSTGSGRKTNQSNRAKTPNDKQSNVPKSGQPTKGDPNGEKKKSEKDNNNKENKSDNAGNKRDSDGENTSKTSGEGAENGLKNDLKDKAKGLTSNATGVDYSDKSLKDQLEHQAADMAMDVTPGLAQVNSARKALKDYNKKKKEMGGKGDGVTDKIEEKADDAVDKGIKGAKFVAGAGAVGSAVSPMAIAATMGFLMMKLLMMLKGLAQAIAGSIAGFFSAIFSAVSSFVSGVLGVGAAVANTVVAAGTAVIVAAGSILGVGTINELTRKDDSIVQCIPTKTSVSQSSQEYIEDGEQSAIREANAMKLWSVYSALGSSKEQTAAVLGNLQAESGLDPTSVETIFSEPFSIGTNKQAAIDNDFNVDLIDADYAARFPAITYVGVGLAQWTNERNRLLINYANDQDVNWYDFDTQIRFMLDGDDKSRQDQLMEFLMEDPSNVEAETEQFMNTWIGLSSPNSSLENRKTNAADYMFTLERATVDTDYADSILSGVNVDRGSGNAAAGAYHQDDGCGKPIKSHYGNNTVDGTGEVPSDLTLVPWSRETLPGSLAKYSKNPEDAGLVWGEKTGWASNIYPDQCVAFATSYFMQLYPDWNKDGRSESRPTGDGKYTAKGWADHYGEKTVDYPTSGAVFSDTTTSEAGHTGIVQHVFANGDILIAEQNIRGVSGEGAGISYSWSWRVIKKERYQSDKWTFFKPADSEPQWNGSKD